MEHWDLRNLEVAPHRPRVLQSRRDEARSIVIALPAGECLGDHQVHERAHLVVIDGVVTVEVDSTVITGESGFMAVFDPAERHEVTAVSDARLLLVLAPWPGAGHPGARDAI